jgi:hypothetical protein
VLGSNYLNDKIGTNMAKKEPKTTSGFSCMEPHETLNVTGSSNFRYLIGLPTCGSGFLNPAPGIKGSGNISPWTHPGLVCLENGTRSDKAVKSLPCMDQEVRR